MWGAAASVVSKSKTRGGWVIGNGSMAGWMIERVIWRAQRKRRRYVVMKTEANPAIVCAGERLAITTINSQRPRKQVVIGQSKRAS